MPTGNLPAEGKKLFEEVYQKALKGSCNGDKGCAAGSAWKAVKNAGWKKDADGKWHKSEVFSEFSMRIDRANYDEATGERRVRIVASDTDEDNHEDNMSLELFNDFIDRIKKSEQPPAEYQSEFWNGGEPYISISHYLDANGKNAPGIIDATYVDGNCLKSKGKFIDTPLGRRCFETICSELYGEDKSREDKIRISIAFLDYMHQHKSNGFIYDRLNSEEPYCSECVKEILTGKSQGKTFLRGLLIHEALTRVPVNTRTSMEVDKSMADKILTRKDDAASIVGDELADELEKEAEVVSKSEALVIKAEEEVPGKVEEECKDATTGEIDPDCMAKKASEVPMTDEQHPKSKSKAKIEKVEPMTKEEITEIIKSTMTELLPKPVESEVPETVAHPLDATFATFKAKFDEIVQSQATEDEKLHSVQEPFNVLGNEVAAVIKSSVKPKESTPEATVQSELAKALSDAMNPIAQKLDLVITQLSAPIAERVPLAIPQRRSISPAIVQQSQAVEAKPTEDNPTPKLRKLIAKTVP